MDAVTYPDISVRGFLDENMIPLRVKHDAQPLAKDFNVTRTPTLVTLDAEGKEHHRTIGFLAPQDLIPSLLLGMSKVSLDMGRFDEALIKLEGLIKDFPESSSAPEAIYLRGVHLFRNTNDSSNLKESYERLQATYPESEWTKRAYPYRLL